MLLNPRCTVMRAGLVITIAISAGAATLSHGERSFQRDSPSQTSAQNTKETKVIIESVLVEGKIKLDKWDIKQVEVYSKIPGTTRPGEAKMALSAGDSLTTGSGVQVKLIVSDDLGTHEVYVFPESKIEFLERVQNPQGPGGAMLLRVLSVEQQSGQSPSAATRVMNWVGGLFVRARGYFDVRDRRVRWGVRGTEFKIVVVNAGGTDTSTVTVMEGCVEAIPESPGSSAMGTPNASSSSPCLETRRGALLRDRLSTASGSPTRERILVKGEVGFASIDGSVRKLNDEVTRSKLLSVIDETSDAILASVPTYTTKYIPAHFAGIKERREAFKTARLDSIITADNARAYETLALVYVDLGLGNEALEAITSAERAYNAIPGWTPSAEFLTARGEAYSLEKMYSQAEHDLNAALKLRPDSVVAKAALAKLGLDRSLDALAKRDAPSARGFLYEPERLIRSSLRGSAGAGDRPTRSVLNYALGELYLRRGDIWLTDKNKREAEVQYDTAQKYCKLATEQDPENPFALKCLGDANRELGTIAKDKGRVSEATRFFYTAQMRYESALVHHGDFAEAHYDLANLFMIRSDPRYLIAAAESYDSAVRLDNTALLDDVDVPNVIFKTRAGAVKVLTDIGLIPKIEGDGNYVLEQIPSSDPKQKVKKGTTIVLKLGPLPPTADTPGAAENR